MMNTVKFCVVFLSMPPPSRVLCETIAMLERECMVAMAIPAGFLPAKPDIASLGGYTIFEMLPEFECAEPILTEEVPHEEVNQVQPYTKTYRQARRCTGHRTGGAWDCRWG